MPKDMVSSAATLANIPKASLIAILNLLKQMEDKGMTLDDCIRQIRSNM